MEILDIVDKNDNVIGAAKKDRIYSQKLCHRIVHILIFNTQGKMALQMRSGLVSFCPNHWSTAVGGHVQSGETCKQGALREFEEELGTTTNIEFFSRDFYTAAGTPNKFLYTYKAVFDGPFNPDPKVVTAVDFFSIKEIEQMIEKGEKFHGELLFILKKHFFGK